MIQSPANFSLKEKRKAKKLSQIDDSQSASFDSVELSDKDEKNKSSIDDELND